MTTKETYMDIGKYRKNVARLPIWRHRGLVVGIIFCLAFVIIQMFCIVSEYEKAKGIEIWSQFEEWYEFKPNSTFSSEARNRYGTVATSVMLENEARVYAEYLTKWSKEQGVDVLFFDLNGLYQRDDTWICSYRNMKSFDMAWQDFKLPLSEGRWFEGTKDEVICVQGSDYEIGDVIKLNQKDGGFFLVTVVAKTEYFYLPNNVLGVSNGVHDSLYICEDDDLELLLLNPLSGHNEKNDRISYCSVLLKIPNEKFIENNSQYGTFSSLAQALKENQVNYVIPIIEMCLGIVFFALFFGLLIGIKEDKWMPLWIWLGGIIGGFRGAFLYYDARYKALSVFALCSILSVLWGFIHWKVSKNMKEDVQEMEVVILQKEDE